MPLYSVDIPIFGSGGLCAVQPLYAFLFVIARGIVPTLYMFPAHYACVCVWQGGGGAVV